MKIVDALDMLGEIYAKMANDHYAPVILIGVKADGTTIAKPIVDWLNADQARSLVARVLVGEIDPTLLEEGK